MSFFLAIERASLKEHLRTFTLAAIQRMNWRVWQTKRQREKARGLLRKHYKAQHTSGVNIETTKILRRNYLKYHEGEYAGVSDVGNKTEWSEK